MLARAARPSTLLLLSAVADAILINAQFLHDDAAQLAHTIAASGKRRHTPPYKAAKKRSYSCALRASRSA